MRPIQAGEELTHAYADCTLPSLQRRAKLRDVYKFDCQCERCEHHSNSIVRNNPLPSIDCDLSDPLSLRKWLSSYTLAHESCIQSEFVDALITERKASEARISSLF